MRSVTGRCNQDFAAIHEHDVELVQVKRPKSIALDALADRLFETRRLVEAHWEQAPGAVDEAMMELAPAVEPAWLPVLCDDVAAAAQVLENQVGCSRVAVRLTTLTGPMCPRFHVDHLTCRLLITLSGPGTQWIPNTLVDRDRLADQSDAQPPILPGHQVSQLATGDWCLLKGGAWGNAFEGVVHRSPPDRCQRLLLSLDPVYGSNAGR